ncbi:MAG: DUF861 domain-containing protein [Saprospiraceae bacterium]|nr:DUF861 domain-containing protein [Saprospiraceae bacterium]
MIKTAFFIVPLLLAGYKLTWSNLDLPKTTTVDSTEEVGDESTSKAIVPRQIDLTKTIYEGSAFRPFEMLNSQIRGAKVFATEDDEYSIGGLEIAIDKASTLEHEYVNFDRSELMYFTSGGMKLTEKDGTVVEAKTGEFIFIPKNWSGTRLFTGDTLVQKFSVVYNQSDNDRVNAEAPALSFSAEDLSTNLYEGEEFRPMEMLNGKVRGSKPFKSGDEEFALGGFHLLINEETKLAHRYEGFPRHEMMFFTKGGMKLVDDEGQVTEAHPGDFLFIPKGWVGKRLFTGDQEVKKFSAVYYEKN